MISHSPALASNVNVPSDPISAFAQPLPSTRQAWAWPLVIAVPSDFLAVPLMVFVVLLSVIVPKSFSAESSEFMLKLLVEIGSNPLK